MNALSEQISIDKFIETLLDESIKDSDIVVGRFSDLEKSELEALKESWPKVNPNRRRHIMRELREVIENDMLVCFDGIAMLALEDSDPDVRKNAVGLLWECEKKHLIPMLIEMMKEDENVEVRAAAATGLGKFVYLGEMEEIPTEAYTQTENALLETIQGEDDKLVRRRALEAVSFSYHRAVHDEIRKAYASNDTDWVASAMFAMGRSADSRWSDMVIENLDHPSSDVQVAAINAAGELSLAEAREPLLVMLEGRQLAEDLQQVIVWSLSQIGGENVRSALEYLLETIEEDGGDEIIEFLESALENLEFNDSVQILDMFDFEIGEEDDLLYGSDMYLDEDDTGNID